MELGWKLAFSSHLVHHGMVLGSEDRQPREDSPWASVQGPDLARGQAHKEAAPVALRSGVSSGCR